MRARSVICGLVQLALSVALSDSTCHGFSASSASSASSSTITSKQQKTHTHPVSCSTSSIENNILILDHLNINHEEGRHDWLKAFYVDFLKCALDPRKFENVKSGKKTVWANIGAHQFHLPEGKPKAQVLDGVVTLAYPNLDALWSRYEDSDTATAPRLSLKGSEFAVSKSTKDDSLHVTDPWGSKFRLIQGTEDDKDNRGKQPGDASEGFGMTDLTIHVPSNASLAGIGRFYEQVLGSKVVTLEQDMIQIGMGPLQTLTFVTKPSVAVDTHVDLREEKLKDEKEASKDYPIFPGNYGIHISLYVADLPSSYQKAEDLGVTYVNTRFSRRAYTLEQSVDDCMFRILSIVDPENVAGGPILQLEHEVRSVIRRDGSKYKSCPFDSVPDGCVTL
ncbi:MAG: hypothetical protein SGILL_004970 [Bacillariaceae sp.]